MTLTSSPGRLAALACSLFLPLGIARGQDGIGLASFFFCHGSPGNRLALAPDIAVELLLARMMPVVVGANAKRAGVLAKAPDPCPSLTEHLRGEVTDAPPGDRREVMRLLDPDAFCEVWPRGRETAQLEVEWFIRRRARTLAPAAMDQLAKLERFGVEVWGERAVSEEGAAPFADTADERAAFLADVTVDAGGVLPRLLLSLGDAEPALGRGSDRRSLWLDVIRDWAPGSGTGSYLPGPGAHILTGRTVLVIGSANEWRSVADACARWRDALETLEPLEWSPHLIASLRRQATALRDTCLVLARVADARPRRPLTAAEADQAAVLVANRDMLAGSMNASGEPTIGSFERTVAIGNERVATFVLGRIE